MSGIRMIVLTCLLFLGILGNIATGLPDAHIRRNENEGSGLLRQLKRLMPREEVTVTVTTYPSSCAPAGTTPASVPPPASTSPTGSTAPPPGSAPLPPTTPSGTTIVSTSVPVPITSGGSTTTSFSPSSFTSTVPPSSTGTAPPSSSGESSGSSESSAPPSSSAAPPPSGSTGASTSPPSPTTSSGAVANAAKVPAAMVGVLVVAAMM